ncbi:MAG: hypothetical protein ACK4MV_20385 [Beijerinckiaceae bacterium]
MVKFLLGLVAAGMAFVFLRMLLVKAGLARRTDKNTAKNEKMSQLRRELDILLWIPPALLVLGAIYALASMAMR